MDSRLEKGSSLSSSSSKRRRQPDNDDHAKQSACRCRRKHLYLALDDWSGGYSIHKLDADDILDHDTEHIIHKLPEPAAVRIASPSPRAGPMAFAALGTTIFVSTNPRSYVERAPPALVYDTDTSALTVGPRVPENLRDLGDAMGAGEALYALTTVPYQEYSSLHALSWAPTAIPDFNPWDPAMAWAWNAVPLPVPPPFDGNDVVTYALHPDGRTLFVSTGFCTYSLDTTSSSNGVGAWKELGDWMLPFRGPAFFVAELDAWVGLHHTYSGYVCCCPVASRSAVATRPPECRMLAEKLFRRKEEDLLRGRETSLTYMGNSRFALVDNILRAEHVRHGSVLHITLFGLEYDHRGLLRTKVRRATRLYAVAKNTPMFSHAAFWM